VIYYELADEVKLEGERIIHAKGKIAFGIGAVVFEICSSILCDRRNVCPISHFQPELGCCLSFPVVPRKKGVLETKSPVLDSGEKALLAEGGSRGEEAE
jgi:L-lactate dehydrogenase